MIDAHSHLSMTGEQFDWWRNEESTAAIALRTLRNANSHLDAGEITAPGQVGRIAEGYHGDFVVLEGSPLEGIRALENVVAVVQGGRIVHGTVPDELLLG